MSPAGKYGENKYTSLLAYIGLVLITSSLPLIASGAVGFAYLLYAGVPWELRPASIMLGYGVLLLSIGLFLSKMERGTIRTGDAVVMTAFVWITVPLLAAVPFMTAAGIPYVDALFEAVSGWTTTGLTILSGEPSSSGGVYVPHVEELPLTLQAWRTIMQWVGGLGIVVFTVAFLTRPGVSAAILYMAEGKLERLEASIRRSAFKMGLIYVVLTIISISLLYFAGMSLPDAVHHAMTGIATAGFSVHTSSLGYYIDKPAVLVAAMIVMFMGAVSFATHDNVLSLRLGKLKYSIELHAQLALIGVSSLFALYLWHSDPGMHRLFSPLQVVFHVASSSATAGFQAGDLKLANDSYKLLLTTLALIGGSAFSTAGGIKVLRMLIAVKSLSMETGSVINPPGYVPSRKLGKYVLDEPLIRRTLAVITAIIATHNILTIMLAGFYPTMYSLADSAFEVASAMGNVGLSVGISAAHAPLGAKLILIASMTLGRLEVITYLVALKRILR